MLGVSQQTIHHDLETLSIVDNVKDRGIHPREPRRNNMSTSKPAAAELARIAAGRETNTQEYLSARQGVGTAVEPGPAATRADNPNNRSPNAGPIGKPTS